MEAARPGPRGGGDRRASSCPSCDWSSPGTPWATPASSCSTTCVAGRPAPTSRAGSTSRARWPTRAGRSRRPRACSTAPTASRSGIVLLEAMASGRPVVAPAAGGPLEIVGEGRGELYAPGDAGAAAAALVETLGDPERAARSRASGRARTSSARTRSRPRAGAGPTAVEGVLAPQAPPGAGAAGAELTLVTVTHNSEPELERLLDSVASPPARRVGRGRGLRLERRQRRRSRGAAESGSWSSTTSATDGRPTPGSRWSRRQRACCSTPTSSWSTTRWLRSPPRLCDPISPERLLAPLVLHPDGDRQDTVHPEPVSPAAVATALIPPAALPRPAAPGRPTVAARPAEPGRRGRSGAASPRRSETLRRLGPFDERIFLYAEDLELGLRAGDLGIETWWWPRRARDPSRGAHGRAARSAASRWTCSRASVRPWSPNAGARAAARWDDAHPGAHARRPDRAQDAGPTPDARGSGSSSPPWRAAAGARARGEARRPRGRERPPAHHHEQDDRGHPDPVGPDHVGAVARSCSRRDFSASGSRRSAAPRRRTAPPATPSAAAARPRARGSA